MRLKDKRGMTLLELMIVVAIVGILAAVAIPAYNGYVTRSRRSDAYTALETVRAAQEMYRAEKGFYASDFFEGATNVVAGCSAGMAGSNYNISINRTDNTHYEALAAATAGGKQANDKYPQFRVNQDGTEEYYDTSWHTGSWEELR
jgi:type IV pilus assembly protein PilE